MNSRIYKLAFLGVLFTFVLNAMFDLFSNSLLMAIAFIVGIFGISHYRNKDSQDEEGDKSSITPTEAPDEIQKWLRKREGKKELYLKADYYENTQKVTINGEENRFYGITAWKKDKFGDKIPWKARMVWNLTDNEFKRHDPEITKSMNAEIFTNPLADLDKFVRNEGRMSAPEQSYEDQQGAAVQQFIQPNNQDQNQERREQEEEFREEPEQ